MKKYTTVALLVLVPLLLGYQAYAGALIVESKPILKAHSVIKNVLSPESVLFDIKRNLLFISNQNYAGKGGEGFISKHNIDGSVIKQKWIDDLVAPKGMAIVGDKLFVSAKTELVEISISEEKIIKRHQHEKAEFLNDVVADKKGNVYVSDMFTSSIYKLSKGEFNVWHSGAELENPNGLFIKGKSMYVSAWGSFNNQKPLTAAKGHFLKINMKSKKIKKVSAAAIGNLDGIIRSGKFFIVSDWVSGEISSIHRPSKMVHSLYKTSQGAGDMEYIKKKRLLFVPMAKTDEVIVLKIDK